MQQAEAARRGCKKRITLDTDFAGRESAEDCHVPGCNVAMESCGVQGCRVRKAREKPCQTAAQCLDRNYDAREGDCKVPGCNVREGDCKVPGCNVREGDCTVPGCSVKEGDCKVPGCGVREGDCKVPGCGVREGDLRAQEYGGEEGDSQVPGCTAHEEFCEVPACNYHEESGQCKVRRREDECQAPECFVSHPHPYAGCETGRMSPRCNDLKVRRIPCANGPVTLKPGRPLHNGKICALERRCCMGAQYVAMLTAEIHRQQERRDAAEDLIDPYLESAACTRKPAWPCGRRRRYCKVAEYR